MKALAIIGCAVAGGVVGGGVGLWAGFRQGGDYNFAPLMTGPIGAVIGGFVGVVAGSLVFT